MKPIRKTCLKFSILPVALLALILTEALFAQAAPSGQALLDAATQGDTTNVNILLAQGAEVNHQGQFGRTALMEASAKGHGAVVRMLLAKGAEVNL
jgi:ankyrin repeat protein